jgi:predicted nucleic acid-binding protein
MGTTTEVLLDTNVLLRTQFDKTFQLTSATRAIAALRANGASLRIATQSLAEFWNVSTRPSSANGYGLTIEETDRRLRFFEQSFRILYESPESHAAWRMLLLQHAVKGVQVHDSRLVSVMLANGISRILTFNTKDFERFREIETVHPDTFPQTS